jgi:hypothetical protein
VQAIPPVDVYLARRSGPAVADQWRAEKYRRLTLRADSNTFLTGYSVIRFAAAIEQAERPTALPSTRS